MKNTILGLILLLCVPLVNAQTTKKIYYDNHWKVLKSDYGASFYRVIKVDEHNKIIDTVRDYYASGELQTKLDGAIKIDSLDDRNSVFTGRAELYYRSGKIEAISKRDSAGMMLSDEGFYEDGKRWYSTTLKNGKRNGETEYLYESGKVKEIVNFVDDKKIGVSRWYYESGRLKEEDPYENDTLNGLIKTYTELNTVLKEEYNYLKGKRNGLAKYYNRDGVLIAEKTFAHDTLKGPYKNYYKNGTLRLEANYVNGRKEGGGKQYYGNGKPAAVFSYNYDLLLGPFTEYWMNGQIARKGTYLNDAMGDCNCFDSTGNKVDCKTLGNDSLSNPTYEVVQQMPNPGYNVSDYLSQHITYPAYERRKNITGTVYINFIVEQDGSVTNVRVLKGVDKGPGLDVEAVRVVKLMPKWKPGMQDGKPVRVSYNIPIRFVLN